MPTNYTFQQKTPATGYGENKTQSHYMNQPMDAARVAIQGVTNGPMTEDATSTPVTSPVTVTTTGVTTLNTPESATSITICSATNTINICEVSSSMSTFFTLPVNTPITIDIANCNQLFLKANTGSATVSFFYNIV